LKPVRTNLKQRFSVLYESGRGEAVVLTALSSVGLKGADR